MSERERYREKKQKEWECLLKKYRLLLLTHGDDLLLERLINLKLAWIGKRFETEYRIFFKEKNQNIQFEIDLQQGSGVRMYSCMPGTARRGEAELFIYTTYMSPWYRTRDTRLELSDFFLDLYAYFEQIAIEYESKQRLSYIEGIEKSYG